MKKTYVKPQVYFEDFQLSASIAGNCGNKDGALHADANTCRFDTKGFFGVLFLTEHSCEHTPQDDDLTTVCYDNPNDANRLFAS